MMDRDRKTEGGASSEPAFDVSQVCLRMRGLFGLTSEFFAEGQIERGQGGAPLQNNNVTLKQTTTNMWDSASMYKKRSCGSYRS